MSPWLTAGWRSRGQSTTWNPDDRKWQIQTKSASCHVSARHKTSIEWSLSSSRTLSALWSRDRLLRKPNRVDPPERWSADGRCCCVIIAAGIPWRRTRLRCLIGRQSLHLKMVFLAALGSVTSDRCSARSSPAVYDIIGGQSQATPTSRDTTQITYYVKCYKRCSKNRCQVASLTV